MNLVSEILRYFNERLSIFEVRFEPKYAKVKRLDPSKILKEKATINREDSFCDTTCPSYISHLCSIISLLYVINVWHRVFLFLCVGGRVYVRVSFNSLLKRKAQQQKEDKKQEWNNTNEDNNNKRENCRYMYIYIYIC